jgi:mono/diheme cytochrome c family protein
LTGIPDFTSTAWQRGRRDSALLVSIRDGKGERMPAFAERLSPEEMRNLLSYVRGFTPPSATDGAAPPDEFEHHFRQLERQLDELNRQFHELLERQ